MRSHLVQIPRRLIAVVLAVLSAVLIPIAARADDTTASWSVTSNDPQSVDNLPAGVLATMRNQEALQPALQAIGDAQMAEPQSGYAGVAFEGKGITLYWKGSLTPRMTSALTTARRSASVTVKSAAYSSAELEAQGHRIDNLAMKRGSADLQAVGYPVQGSQLDITLEPVSSQRSSAQARAAAGLPAVPTARQLVADAGVTVPVRYKTAIEAFSQASNRDADNAPWNGGDEWTNRDKGNSCTTGFGVHNGVGASYVLTAGHCGDAGDRADQGDTYMGPIHASSLPYDIALITGPGWDLIFDGAPGTSRTKKVMSWGYWAYGELVCQSGAVSGTVCNIQEDESSDYTTTTPSGQPYTEYGLIACYKLDNQAAVQKGDSGGPVFTLDGSGVRAKGTVTGYDNQIGTRSLLFQDWADDIRQFGIYPNVIGEGS